MKTLLTALAIGAGCYLILSSVQRSRTMSDTEKAKSIRGWEDFAARCQVGRAERRRILERRNQRRHEVKEGK